MPIADLATGGGKVFAAGARGTVLEWTGHDFRRLPAPTVDDLTSIWAAGPKDIWVASAMREIYRFDGMRWSKLAAEGGRLRGSASDDLWFDTQHYDGTQVRDSGPPMLGLFLDLLVAGRDDVWVLGLMKRDDGTIEQEPVLWHYDGASWTPQRERLPASFWSGRLARVDGEIWAHDSLRAFAFDGVRWRELPQTYGIRAWELSAVSAPGAAITLRSDTITLLDGSSISRVPAHTQCVQARRVREDEVFCVSNDGQAYRFDGSSWRLAPQDPFGATASAEQWGRVPPALWAGNAMAAWGSAPDHVFRLAGLDPIPLEYQPVRLERYDGSVWTEIARGQFFDIVGTRADDIWIVGKPLLHWDGEALREVPLPAESSDATPIAAVSFGRSAWFVADRAGGGTLSQVLRYDGAWTVQYERSSFGDDPARFEGIAGRGDDDIWVLEMVQPILRYEGTGRAVHHDGSSWRAVELWESWGFGQLALDGDELWLTDTGGVYRLRESDLRPGIQRVAGSDITTFEGSLDAYRAKLWLGSDSAWLTTAKQAMRLAR